MIDLDLFETPQFLIPKSPKLMEFRTCSFADIRHIFKEFHYKEDNIGGGISWCFGAFFDGMYMAGMVVGKPRHEKKYSEKGEVVELRRMACLDSLPHNSESWFIAQCLRWMKKHTTIARVISYSDLSVGHIGTIYKASNFKLIGKTAPSKHVFWKGKRYHPRSLTIDRKYSYEMRAGLDTGDTVIEIGEPKLIFEYMLK